jgi:ABC-type multidrug transport system ATPase subunit
VYKVWIDRDERRELLTLEVTDRDGTSHPAQALSDGSLRFLALAVLELSPEANGLLCLEEPENGIHPERIPAMLRLLQDIATDVTEPIGPGNPLRQVIINTHSPAVVSQIPEDSLLVAELKEVVASGRRFKGISFSGLPDTWRQANGAENAVSRGKLLAYLNPVAPETSEVDGDNYIESRKQSRRSRHEARRVVDRPDFRQLMMFPSDR